MFRRASRGWVYFSCRRLWTRSSGASGHRSAWAFSDWSHRCASFSASVWCHSRRSGAVKMLAIANAIASFKWNCRQKAAPEKRLPTQVTRLMYPASMTFARWYSHELSSYNVFQLHAWVEQYIRDYLFHTDLTHKWRKWNFIIRSDRKYRWLFAGCVISRHGSGWSKEGSGKGTV